MGICVLVAGCAAVPGPGGGAVAASTTDQPGSATLTALAVAVQRQREGTSNTSLELGDRVGVLPNDRIAIDQKGRGLLRFQDTLSVELFRDTQMEIGATHVDRNGDALVNLKQTFGHSAIDLKAQARQRVELDTDVATITTLSDDTQVIVCHDPGKVTCMVTTRGEAVVEAQGVKQSVNGGQGTFVAAGKPPEPATCIHPDELQAWLDKMRANQEVPSLGALVADWEKQPCPGTGQSTPYVAPAATAPYTTTTPAPAATVPYTVTKPAPAATAIPLPSAEGMVRLAPGAYTLGGPSADANHVAAHSQNLPGSFIDANLVTYAQYQAFLDQTGRPAPATWGGHTYPAGHEQYPVEGLTFDDARSYCSFVDKRLPSEVEWEAAGRGPGANPPVYPWGVDPTAGGKVDQITPTGTYPVGSLAFNKSRLGVYDMIGAVWQWVAPPYAPLAGDLQILRGGRHGFLQDLTYRQPARTDDERFTRVAGVRCAADQVAAAG